MANLTVFLILTFVGSSFAAIYQLSGAEKREIMNEVDRLRKEMNDLRSEMLGSRNPIVYEPITWSDQHAASAEAVAHRCEHGCQSLPHDDLSNVQQYFGFGKLTHQGTIKDLKSFIQQTYKLEVAKAKRDLNVVSRREMVQHHTLPFEGKYIGCGAVTHNHNGRPFVHIVCHFSEEPY